MNFKPVILSGGSGTRLWPMSRATLPKQFISFPGKVAYFLIQQNGPWWLDRASSQLLYQVVSMGFFAARR